MASTYSPTLRIEMPATGDQNNAWATTFDNNWNVPIEQGISGVSTVALPDANYTLTTANAAADQARLAVIVFTGALTAQRTITAPAVPKLYILRNQTNQRLLIVTAGGGTTNVTDTGIPQPRSAAPYSADSTTAIPKPGVMVPAGTTAYVWTDGTLFDYCVNGFDGSISADSIVLPSPLPVSSGGTSSSTTSDARTALGLGSTAVLDAAVLNNPNQVVQRDSSGNFTANTITAGLNGIAATSSNTFLLGNLSPASYEAIGVNSGFLNLPFTPGNPLNIDLYNNFGAGVIHCWWRENLDPTDRFASIYVIGNGLTVNLNSQFVNTNTAGYGQFLNMNPGGGPSSNGGVLLGFVKRSIHQ